MTKMEHWSKADIICDYSDKNDCNDNNAYKSND